jgi:hypothetical protein
MPPRWRWACPSTTRESEAAVATGSGPGACPTKLQIFVIYTVYILVTFIVRRAKRANVVSGKVENL